MKYLSVKQAANWLNKNAVFDNKTHYDKKKLKKLRKSFRLVPVKDHFYHRRYSMLQLKGFRRDMAPHGLG